MRDSWRFTPWLMLLGCWSRPEATPSPESTNVFLPPTAPAASGGAALPPEPMSFTGAGARFDINVNVAGQPTHHTIDLLLSSLRLGDVPTLAHPIGFVRFDPLTWKSDAEPQAHAITDGYFRAADGSPIQVFFDVQSITKLPKRLDPGTTDVPATVLGVLQIGDRQMELDFPAVFSRFDADHLSVRSTQPIRIPLASFGRADPIAGLATRLGGAIGPEITASLTLDLKRFDGAELPTFVRTPVSVQSVQEIRERLDAEINDFDVAKERLRQQGSTEQLIDRMDKEHYDKIKDLTQKRIQEKRQGGPRLPPSSPPPPPQ